MKKRSARVLLGSNAFSKRKQHTGIMPRSQHGFRSSLQTLQSSAKSQHSAGETSNGFDSNLSGLLDSSRGGDRDANGMKFVGWNSFRLMVYDIVESRLFGGTILALIFMNTALIAIQTDRDMDVKAGWYFGLIDIIFLSIYIFELGLKFYAYRSFFFKSGWNNFDLCIVLMSVFEVMWLILIGSLAGFNPKIFRLLRIFRAIRAFRALRVLRTITFFRNLQIIVTTLLRSIPAWGSITLLIVLVLYIFCIIGVTLYGNVAPSRFGNIWVALFTLFQLVTLDDWSEVYNEIKPHSPSVIIYLIVFIVVETFIFINLFIAVIVSNLEQSHQKNTDHIRKTIDMKRKKKAKLRQRMASFSVLEELTGYRKPTQHYVHHNEMNECIRDENLKHSLGVIAAIESNTEELQQHLQTLDNLVQLGDEEDF